MSRSGIINIFNIIGFLHDFAFGPLIGWNSRFKPSLIGSQRHVSEILNKSSLVISTSTLPPSENGVRPGTLKAGTAGTAGTAERGVE